jgi:trimeric autotransporter adhesin
VINANSANSSAYGSDVAIGANSANSLAVGHNTSVGAFAPGAVAMGTDSAGNGAVASLPNQYVMGTANHTYTAPGITSATSKARQSGPLEVVTSDANGNLATDGGQIFATLDDHETRISKNSSDISKNRADIRRNRNQINQLSNRVDENQEGVAVAMSVHGPDLVTNESFGVSMQWAGFESGNAIGGGVTGVVYRDETYRFALTGGVGVGLDEGTVGGRAGGQLTW